MPLFDSKATPVRSDVPKGLNPEEDRRPPVEPEDSTASSPFIKPLAKAKPASNLMPQPSKPTPEAAFRRSDGWGQRPRNNRRRPSHFVGDSEAQQHSHSKPEGGAGNTAPKSQEVRVSSNHKSGPPKTGLRASAPEFVPGGRSLMGRPVQDVERQNGSPAEQSNSNQVSNGSRRRGGNRGGASKSWRPRNDDNENVARDEGPTLNTDDVSIEGTERQQEKVAKMMEELATSKFGGEEGGLRQDQGASTSYAEESGNSSFETQVSNEPILGEEERAANEQEQQDEVRALKQRNVARGAAFLFSKEFVDVFWHKLAFKAWRTARLPTVHERLSGVLLLILFCALL